MEDDLGGRVPQGLQETVRWYVDHPAGWERVMSGAYRQYFDTQYRARLNG